MTVPHPPDLPQELRNSLMTGQVKDSNLAIASLITGILGWILIPIFGSLAAIITGHLANKEIDESNGLLSGRGMATAGLILGYVQLGFFFLALIMIIVLLIIFSANISDLISFSS
jgi:hypothetical protein